MPEISSRLQSFIRSLASTEKDDVLLRRFHSDRDPAALDQLVRRYASLVMNVCRRRFGWAPEADDAFQTTFLLLAKNAGNIRNLPGWLHRVAHLTTIKLSGKRVASMESEPLDNKAVPPTLAAEQHELKSVVDELVAELPERFRDVVVLCCLESLSNAEAAARLKVPVGTICSRLHTAKKLLKPKLMQRGIVAGMLFALAVPRAAPASQELIKRTVESAVAFVKGEAVANSVVHTLAKEVQKSMTLVKSKMVSAAVIFLLLAGITSSEMYMAQATPEEPKHQQPNQKADAPPPKTLEIVATDARTGKPLEGAIIRLFGLQRPTPYVRTDAQGRATAPYPMKWTALVFDIHTPSHVQQRVDVAALPRASGAPPVRVEVKLFPGDRTLGGRLIDEEGNPVVGAVVRLGAYPAKARHPAQGMGELICDVDAVTDQDGRWKLGCIEGQPTAQHLEINHPDFVFVNYANPVPAPLEELLAGKLTTVLKHGLEVVGRVVDEHGLPITGATVVAGDPPLDLSPTRCTGADGKFHFASLGKGRNVLTVQATGKSPAYRVFDLSKRTEIEFKLPTGRTVTGRVTDQDGKPVALASVSASFPGVETGLRLWTTADNDGKYNLVDAPQDAFTVSPSLNGYSYHAGELVLPGKLARDLTLTKTTKLRGTVVDAETGQPIPKFTAAHNTSRSNSSTIPPTDLPAQFGFNMHFYETHGRDGKFELELFQQHNFKMQVGVWAPGYRITRSEYFLNNGKDREFQLKLYKETRPKIAGIVRRPDGKPAAGAIAYLANRHTIYEGFVNGAVANESSTDRWQRCDKEGKFSFPPQDEETIIGISDESGWATRSLSVEKSTNKLEVLLTPWARIEGTFVLDGRPKPGAKISFHLDPEWQTSPKLFVRYVAETVADAQGRFVLDRVVSVPGSLMRLVEFGRGGTSLVIAKTTPRPGETLRFAPARQEGRTVIGQLKLTSDIKNKIALPNDPTYRCAGTECNARSDRPGVQLPPEVAKAGDKAKYEWLNKWTTSPEGIAYNKAFQYCPVWMEPDGRIRIDGVKAGKLILTMPLRSAGGRDQGELVATVAKRFEVPAMKDGWCDEPLDLGEIDIEVAKGVRRGDSMPEITVASLDGKEWKLSDYRGKVIVIDVWATWCGPCLAALPKLAALQTEYVAKGMELVGLSVDDDANLVADLTKRKQCHWRQCHIGPQSKLLETLGVEAFPTVFIVGVDGKLLYRGHSIESAATEVRAALTD